MKDELIEPKELIIDNETFSISKVPAIPMREIMAKYPVSNMPKIGNYEVSEEIMLKLMSYVRKACDHGEVSLHTRELINNHVKDWEVLAQLEFAMIDYNTSFFNGGKGSTILTKLFSLAEREITKISTVLSEQLLAAVKQHSENSEQSTR